MAPNTWNTSSPAAEPVSIRSSRLTSAMPRSFSIATVASSSAKRPTQAIEPDDRQRVAAARIVEKRDQL